MHVPIVDIASHWISSNILQFASRLFQRMEYHRFCLNHCVLLLCISKNLWIYHIIGLHHNVLENTHYGCRLFEIDVLHESVWEGWLPDLNVETMHQRYHSICCILFLLPNTCNCLYDWTQRIRKLHIQPWHEHDWRWSFPAYFHLNLQDDIALSICAILWI